MARVKQKNMKEIRFGQYNRRLDELLSMVGTVQSSLPNTIKSVYATELFESILLNIPITGIWLSAEEGETLVGKIKHGCQYTILDGVKRLDAMKSFMSGEIPTSRFELLGASQYKDYSSQYEDYYWEQLPSYIRRRINEYMINFVVFDYLTDEQKQILTQRLQKTRNCKGF